MLRERSARIVAGSIFGFLGFLIAAPLVFVAFIAFAESLGIPPSAYMCTCP